jgi:IS1 family transposase
VTLIRRLSIKSKRSRNPARIKAKTFWNPKTSNVSYARPKNASRAKPIRQETVEKTGKVRFSLLSAFNVRFGERNSVRRFSLWLSASAFPFAASLIPSHLKKYVFFLLTPNEFIRILSNSQLRNMAYKRLPKEKQALVLSALREGTPVRAVARMFKTGKGTITRVIRETGEAFADYMDENFRDLPCLRIEMDEQWQYVGCHSGRMLQPEKERGDFWLWACIDADTKLVFSHTVGKRDWITGNLFVEDVRNRVKGAVQIATDNLPAYPFHIRQHFGYEGYSYGTETKIFGEPKLPDGTLARLGRNEGVRKMQTAERKAVVGSPDLESLTTSHIERTFLTIRQELKRYQRKGLGFSKDLYTHRMAVALHFGIYNFVRRHETLATTPAVAAGLEEKPWSLEKVVEMTADYMRRKEDAQFEIEFSKAGI